MANELPWWRQRKIVKMPPIKERRWCNEKRGLLKADKLMLLILHDRRWFVMLTVKLASNIYENQQPRKFTQNPYKISFLPPWPRWQLLQTVTDGVNSLSKRSCQPIKRAALTLADDFAMQMLRHFCVSHFTNLGIGCSNIVSPWIWSKPTLLENEEQKKWAWVAQWAMPTRQRRKERSSNVRSCAHCKCWQRNERSTDVTLAC